MRVLITGASGLVGSAVVSALRGQGHVAATVSRSDKADVRWNPECGDLDAGALGVVDAVVHLAGENIAAGRWTAERKRRIMSSRVEGTRQLCKALGSLARRPAVLVSASAVGYYGDGGDRSLDEQSPRGTGFLSDVCEQWEAATEAARDAGIRVVHARLGVVLSPDGGALARMLPAFRLGLGGPLGSGSQYMSWAGLSDAVRALLFMLEHQTLSGPVNVVSPTPVTNGEFTRLLARAVRRPAWFRAPAFALRLALGEMAEALLLSGARVYPNRLLEEGFEFEAASLEEWLSSGLRG